jgi:serine/threonine protein kinase
MASQSISHYRIIRKLGAGGMGDVYLAEDTKLDRKVALKILPSGVEANVDRMRRFVLEAKAAAALSHPNIAHIYEIGETNDTHYIAMEYVEGETLREKIRRGKSELRVLLKDLLQTAEGLAKAHEAGIVHRDLKPENIMVTRDGYAKILDFGLAKLLEQKKQENPPDMSEAATTVMPAHHSTPGVVMGTVGYMSPEQARGRSVDQRSDIFSFGCILYEAAAGRRPFDADSVIDTLHKIIYEAPPSISDLNPSAPSDLQRIVRKALAKEPGKRYQTIRDVANDLEEVLDGLGDTTDERPLAPPANATTGGAIESTDADRISQGTNSALTHQTASSAEFMLTQIKQHKAVVALALTLLIASTAGAYFYLARRGGAAIDSIAVLPFVNTSNEPNMEYLSDGISESLINSLTELQQLRVVARTTAFRYKGREIDPRAVGRELNVRAVLMGRVRQVGNVFDIQVDLVDASTGAQLWGEEYNREISGVLAVKQDIAREITEKLRLRLSGEERKHLTGRDTTNAQPTSSICEVVITGTRERPTE